jgi:hypothetical protein
LNSSNASEHRGLVRDYALFLTLNQTLDEYENSLLRIHIADARKMKSKQVINLFQHASSGRFYDAHRTLSMLWDKEKNEKIGSKIELS